MEAQKLEDRDEMILLQIKSLVTAVQNLGFSKSGKNPGTAEKIAIALENLNQTLDRVADELSEINVNWGSRGL